MTQPITEPPRKVPQDAASASDPARLNLLLDVLLRFAAHNDRAALLTEFVSQLAWVLDFERCQFGFVDQTVAASNRQSPVPATVNSPFDAEILRQVMTDGILRCGDDADAGKAVLCLPMCVDARTIGAVLLHSRRSTAFDRSDIRFAQAAVVFLALALDRIGRMESLTRSNELVRQRSEELNRVLNAVPSGMLMVRSDGTITFANSALLKLFGYESDKLIGQPVEVLLPERFRSGHPELRNTFFHRPVSREMGQGRDLFARRADGSELPVEIGLNPVETADGISVLASVVDLTERKQLEEALTRNAAQLARANEALAQSNIELQQFAYIASHDLQAPLRGIAGFAQFLQQDYQGRLDANADEYVGQIVDGTQRMQRLINDLLAYSRVESRERAFARTDLAAVFADSISLLHAEIEDARCEVTRDELPTVVGDPAQLTQLLQNLIGNAVKYHGDEPPRVRVSCERNDSGWTIAVRDNGIGMEAKHFERIFEIFRRLHTQEQYPGTGIGLAVCRRIVLRHGGRIWVESEVGQGSTFFFTVPERVT